MWPFTDLFLTCSPERALTRFQQPNMNASRTGIVSISMAGVACHVEYAYISRAPDITSENDSVCRLEKMIEKDIFCNLILDP